jgi:hypothetical protein
MVRQGFSRERDGRKKDCVRSGSLRCAGVSALFEAAIRNGHFLTPVAGIRAKTGGLW